MATYVRRGLLLLCRYASATCANASADFHESRHLHSFVISPASHVTDANTTLPVFSQTKIRGVAENLTQLDMLWCET